MNTPEFVDTYSDDVLYLLEARSALLTHPLRNESKELLDASICRLFAVFMIGSIEMMLKHWIEKDHHEVLKIYFADRDKAGKQINNGQRVAALCDAFTKAAIPVDPNVFDDYLAIKYLRNTIIHINWKEHERQWLVSRGFPADTRKLTKEHLDRMTHVNENIIFYIALTTVAEPGARKPDKQVRLDENATKRSDETGILRIHDLDRIIWNNLERIYELIYKDVETAAITEPDNWAAGWSKSEIESMTHPARKRLFYLAARRAGERNHNLLSRHRELAKEALAFWQEYWKRAVLNRGVRDGQIEDALSVLRSPEFARLASDAPWCLTLADVRDNDAHHFLGTLLGESTTVTGEQVANALRIGRLTWELIPNIMPVALFTVCLPMVDPENTSAYLSEARRALAVFRLNGTWYSWVEQHLALTEDNVDFYGLMIDELSKRTPLVQ